MLEVQQAVLRRRDEFGVVRPSRSDGGQRRYSRTEITIVQYVAQLADEGMTLAAIRRVLELEEQVKALEAERDALLAALAERAHLLAPVTRGGTNHGSQPRAWPTRRQPPGRQDVKPLPPPAALW